MNIVDKVKVHTTCLRMEIYIFLEVKISFLLSCQSLDRSSVFFHQKSGNFQLVGDLVQYQLSVCGWILQKTWYDDGYYFYRPHHGRVSISVRSNLKLGIIQNPNPITNKYVQIRASPKSHTKFSLRKKIQRKNENIFGGWLLLGVLFVLHHIFEQIYSLKNVIKKIFCCCFTS